MYFDLLILYCKKVKKKWKTYFKSISKGLSLEDIELMSQIFVINKYLFSKSFEFLSVIEYLVLKIV